jgi:hypothetical protein
MKVNVFISLSLSREITRAERQLICLRMADETAFLLHRLTSFRVWIPFRKCKLLTMRVASSSSEWVSEREREWRHIHCATLEAWQHESSHSRRRSKETRYLVLWILEQTNMLLWCISTRERDVEPICGPPFACQSLSQTRLGVKISRAFGWNCKIINK